MKIYQVSRQTLDGLEEKKWFTNKRKAQKQKTEWKRDEDSVQIFNIFETSINTNRKGICHFLDLWTNE
jgi:hypothetical protein